MKYSSKPVEPLTCTAELALALSEDKCAGIEIKAQVQHQQRNTLYLIFSGERDKTESVDAQTGLRHTI